MIPGIRYETWIGLVVFFFTLVIDLITDYRIWLNKKTVKHLRGLLLRCIGLIPSFIMMNWYSAGLVFLYWVLMDGGMGVLISRNWFFIGTTGKLDQLKRKYPWLILVEYGGMVAGLAFFISNWLN